MLGLCLALTQMPCAALAAEPGELGFAGEDEPIAVQDIAIERESADEELLDDDEESIELLEEAEVPEEVTAEPIHEEQSEAADFADTATSISSAAEFAAIKDNLSGSFILTKDIDLSSYSEWTPIGVSESEAFTGILDGNGHTVKLGTVSGTSYDYFGLFGCAKNATIKNLDVQITTTAGMTVGAIAGYAYNVTMESCSASGAVVGSKDTGGLIGYAENTFVRNCYSTATVTNSSSSGDDGAGGLIGEMHGSNSGTTKVVSCYALGEISKTATTDGIGGIAGRRTAYYYGNTVIQFSFYGEVGASDKKNGFGVKNEHLQDPATFVGWDFDHIWALDSTHDGYPYLKRTGAYQTFELSGIGSVDNPYIITSEEELAAIARGEIGTDTFSYCYKLGNDITLTGTYWTPIGGNSMPALTGTFDGAGHKISNLKIDAVGYSNQGLFGTFKGILKNLDVVNAKITDSATVGILGGDFEGATVEACSTEGSVIGTENVGGLIGYSENTTVRNCYSTATVTGNSNNGDYGIGGLVGRLHGANSGYSKIIMSYASGVVSKSESSSTSIGGLVGKRSNYYYGKNVILDSYFSARTRQSDRNNGFSLSPKVMQKPETFVYWDFENIWQCNSTENGGLPTLRHTKDYQPVKLKGQGTATSPYIISNEQDLASVARGETGANNYTAYYKLDKDITITSEYWTPIGGNGTDAFNGNIDGQGHSITGLTIIYRGYGSEGLIGEGSGNISNLIMKDVLIKETTQAGAIYGSSGSNTVISACESFGEISGTGDMGGLVGHAENTKILNSFSRMDITSSSTATEDGVGGLVGELHGANSQVATIKDSYAAGKLIKENTKNGIGGLAGYRSTYYYGRTIIYDSFYDTTVTGVKETVDGFGITSDLIKDASTFTYWDFKNVWAVDDEVNDGYPYLTFKGDYTPVVPEGSGVELDPYYITNEYELAALAKGELELNGYYLLDNDVIITSKYWTPISCNGEEAFSGVFDGDGHTIAGLTINVLGYEDEGLFGYVSGTIKNLRVSGTIKNAHAGGMLCSVLKENAKVMNCATLGAIASERTTGGLICYAENATIQDCYSRVTVTNITDSDSYSVGGLIGQIHGANSQKCIVTNCYATGDVTKNSANLGGLIGKASTYYHGTYVVTSSYYDNKNDGSTDKGTYVSTEDMKKKSTYVDWDFAKTWSIASTENDGYPQLKSFEGQEIPTPSDTVDVRGVELNKGTLTLKIGDSETLSATVLPVSATNKNVSWKSSNTSVATVDANGKVTAVAAGTANITVTTEDGNKTATCKVTVTASEIKPTAIALNQTTLSLKKGETEALTASFTPEDATDTDVTWSSDDTSVATVNESGLVTAIAKGTATVTVTLVSDSKIKATCEVTVTEESTVVKTTAVTLNKKTLSLEKNATETLTVTFDPKDATDKVVEWSSSNTSVATVDANGKVTAVAKGTATVTVNLKSDSSVKDTCQVTVTESDIPGPGPGPEPEPEPIVENYNVKFYVDGFDELLKAATIEAGDTIVDVLPDTADVMALIPDGATFLGWYIDGTSILWDVTAPVNRHLDLEARYIAADGGDSSSDPGSGRDPGLILEDGEDPDITATYFYDVYMVKGQSYTFPVKYGDLNPESADASKKITWTTSDKTTIKITGNYKAKALLETDPEDNVYVSDNALLADSEYVYAIHIVEPKLKDGTTEALKTYSLIKGETVQLTMDGFGEYEDYYDISWNTTNAEIARADDGLITAAGAGTAKVSAFVNGKAYTCTVKVVNSKTPAKITGKEAIKLAPLQSATLKFKISGFKASGLVWADEEGQTLPAYNKSGALVSGSDKVAYYQNDVVRITPAGKVTAVGVGSTTITATSKNNIQAEVKITVPEPVANVVYVNKGKSKNIKYYNVKNGTWNYGDSDSVNVIDLDRKKGKVTGVSAGKALVKCAVDPYNTGNNIEYSTIVFVDDPTIDVSATGKWSAIKKSSATLTLNNGEKFVVKLNDTYQPAIFTSNKAAVAFVDEAGVVSARGTGTATLTTRINGMKFTIKVVVK